MRLWFFGQWGSTPSVVEFYDERTSDVVDPGMIAGAYNQARSEMLASTPRVQDVTRGPRGTLVTLELLSRDSAPVRESFLVQRQTGGWRVLHDTFLERNLASYAQAFAQNRLAPGRERADPRALRAGFDAAFEYRRAQLRPAQREGTEEADQAGGSTVPSGPADAP